jgi:diadenosine tetraphosphatase ApaH/serine/threonine PP2A family protein phosphatase
MDTTIRRLTGVYHADGGLLGELTYVLGKLRGTAHCGLCDITHRGVRVKPAWAGLVAGLGVPFDVVHLNERDEQVRAASEGHTPCVLAHTDSGVIWLLGPVELAAAGGDVERFATVLRAAAARAGSRWPSRSQ